MMYSFRLLPHRPLKVGAASWIPWANLPRKSTVSLLPKKIKIKKYSLFLSHVPAVTLVENNLWWGRRSTHGEKPWSGKASINTMITNPYVLCKGPCHPGCCCWYVQTHIVMKGSSIIKGLPWPGSKVGLYPGSHLILTDRDYWSHFIVQENWDPEAIRKLGFRPNATWSQISCVLLLSFIYCGEYVVFP